MKTAVSFFEQNGGTYTRVGDVLLPDLILEETESKPIGKYGLLLLSRFTCFVCSSSPP